MGRIAFFACSTALVLASGCSADDSARDERIGKMRGAIIGGSLDTTHQAVVALFGNQSACTATIVAVDGSTGYALTAAHCVNDPPQVVVQGNDYNSSSTIDYQVTDYQAHPSYNGQYYDFAMVKFIGASGSTPVIPAMTDAEDNLVDGSAVEFVGYGVTEFSNSNTKRYHVGGSLANVSALLLEYYQQNGGPCSGDSGGPSLSVVGGQERVSGVTSYGDENCTQFGASGRVSAVFDSFVQPFISGGGGGGSATCDQCAQGSTSGSAACADEWDSCAGNQACVDFVNCVGACGSNDACVDACVSQNQAGAQVYVTVINCICDDACPAECATECAGSGSGSTSTTSSSGVSSSGVGGAGTTSGDPAGVGGAAAGTTGAGAGDGETKGDDDDDDDDERSNDSEGGCSTNAGGAASPAWIVLAAAMAALTLRRRRHHD
jgi:MYXO-CTERM domain-containing protein